MPRPILSRRPLYLLPLVLLLVLFPSPMAPQLVPQPHDDKQQTAVEVENFALPPDPQAHGSTVLVPHPSEAYQHLEDRFPYLAPLPNDRGSHGKAAQWPTCAWQVATEPSASSFGLLDLNAYYHTLVIWDFAETDVYRIKGTFPATRYFSVQSYEFTNGKPIASLLDRDIRPAWGTNPHADLSATVADRGTFEIYVTAHGDYGYPNELQALRGYDHPQNKKKKKEPVTIIYRMYDADPVVAKGNWTPKQRFWGFADPAVVEHRSHHDDTWTEVPPCTDFGAGLFQATFTDLYPIFKHFPATPMSCPMAQLSDDVFPSLILFGAGLEQGYAASITSYTNYDTRYLYWCAQEAKVGPHIVIRMQGTLPRVPQGLYMGWPRVAEPLAYEARYISISTIDMLYPSPTYQEVDDHDIERFYLQVPGWGEHDRTYAIVFAMDPSIPQACGLYDSDTQLFLAWNDAYHHGLDQSRMPSIVYRELSPTLAAGSKSLMEVEKACKAAGKESCGDGEFLKRAMGDTYPRIDVWSCDPATGKATLLA